MVQETRPITHAIEIMAEASMILAKDAAKLPSLIQNSMLRFAALADFRAYTSVSLDNMQMPGALIQQV